MNELRKQLLNELIEEAYAEKGDAPLTEEETNELVNECVRKVEEASYPTTTVQGK